MNFHRAIRNVVWRMTCVSLLTLSFVPSPLLAADLTYSEDVTVTVAGVDLVILAKSTASRLVVGTANLVVDVPAGEKFFLISRDGTAMPNTVLIGNEAQAAAAQSCSLNAQGQATSNVLPLFGATSGTKTVTITPVFGTKCTAPGGGASSGGGGGSGAVSVSGGSTTTTTTTTTTSTTPSTPNFIDSGTATSSTTQTAAPSTSGITTAPATAPSAASTASAAAAPAATPTEIKKQTADVATKALDVVAKALEKAAAPAAAPAQSSTAGSAQATAPAQQQAAAPVLVVQVSSSALTIAAKFVPTDATPTERAIMQVIVDNPPPAALKKGMGEWGGALNSTRIANNGDIPTEPEKLKAFVANAGLVLNGRFPLPEFKNPDLEQKMIVLLEILYDRKMAPSEDPPGLYDRNAIIVAAYGLRQVERKLEKEKACEKPVTDTLVNKGRVTKNSGEYWNLVNACAYSGATR